VLEQKVRSRHICSSPKDIVVHAAKHSAGLLLKPQPPLMLHCHDADRHAGHCRFSSVTAADLPIALYDIGISTCMIPHFFEPLFFDIFRRLVAP